MSRSRWILVLSCALCSMAFACGGDDEGDDGGNSGGAGAAGAPRAGAGAGGAGAGGAGMGAAGMGMAGMGAAPDMPDAMCIAMAVDPTACSRCACTPNAMGGCLDELTACQGTMDDMSNMLCGAILACAQENGCSGTACVMPCMAEITAASSYMGAAPLTAVMAVSACTAASCAAACM